jgi:arylsulfatase A-like enzyme
MDKPYHGRVKFAHSLIGLYLLGACAEDPTPRPERAAGQSPNVILILADDLGYGDLGCYQPASKIPTPSLDRLASQGLRGLDSHSPSAVCTPTRYGILTGRYAWRTWLQQSVLLEWDPPLIEEGRLTLPAMLGQHGFHSACIGKWHLGWDWPITAGRSPNRGGGRGLDSVSVDFSKPIAGGPTARGFDHYFGHDVPNFPPYCFIEDDRVVVEPSETMLQQFFGVPGPMAPGWKPEAELPELTSRAVAYIKERATTPERPFFLFFTMPAPHTPIAPLEEFRGKSGAGIYGDFVHQVDHSVGRVLEAVDKAGIAPNTLVIFASDNGSPGRSGEDMCGEVRSVTLETGHDPNLPWRGIKADIHEGGHRVPFIVRWPGVVMPGTVTDEVTCHTDLFATLAEIVGHPLGNEAGQDSYSLLDVWKGKESVEPLREATMHHSIDGLFALRQGKWKLIFGRGTGGWTAPSRVPVGPGEPAGQLYDLETDPMEKANVFADHPEVVESMVELARSYVDAGRSVPVR